MPYALTVQDLPDEMLEQILLHLELADRKSAQRVCKRWSALQLFDLSSVQLVIDYKRFYRENYQDYHRALLASNRQFKHICFGGSIEYYVKTDYEMDAFQTKLVKGDRYDDRKRRVSYGECFEYEQLVDILGHFSGSVESLMLSLSRYRKPTSLKLFAKITALPNLKQFYMAGEFESGRDDVNLYPMNNLEKLSLNNNRMLTSIPNIQDIFPNITILAMANVTSKESLNFLRHFSAQLVELKVTIAMNFLTVCPMRFPLLERLSFSFLDLKGEDLHEESGLRGIPLLCQSAENLQFLFISLRYSELNPDSLLAICKLKHLKSLHLYCLNVSVPEKVSFPPLESLRELTLEAVRIFNQLEFNRFCRYAFPNLAVLEMKGMYRWATNRDLSFELFGNVCSNIPSLKRLTLFHSGGDLQLSPFLQFCASRAPRELKIKCGNVFDTSPLEEFGPIAVEILIMEVRHISLDLLHKLVKSMGRLKQLELIFWLQYLPSFLTLSEEFGQRLRDAFPRCKIDVKCVVL